MNLHATDPEFMERFEHFAFEEVVYQSVDYLGGGRMLPFLEIVNECH